MAKTKYTIIDTDDNPVGFVVIEKPHEFEQAHSFGTPALAYGGPLADVVLLFGALAGFTGAAWFAGGPPWAAPVVGIAVTGLLAGIKAWRGSLLPEQQVSDEVLIKGEFKSDDGTLYLDEITDKFISLTALGRLCIAIERHNFVWLGRGKAKLWANVSRDQHDRIREQFNRLNYFRGEEGGQVVMAGRGRLFVRKVAELGKSQK
jgi:hypothetical protein